MTGPPIPIDYTALGYDAMRDAMLDAASHRLPEWTDLSENDMGVLLIELFALACDITLYYQTRIAANLLPETSDEPEALTQLLRLIGYELQPPTAASADLRIAVDGATVPPFVIPARSKFFVPAAANGEGITFEALGEFRISDAELTPADPVSGLRYFSPLPVVEGVTRLDDPLAVSDGTPSQLFRLRGRPVIAGSIELRVAEPGGETLWREVESLADSLPLDRDFVVRRASDGSAQLLLGDGINGMIPPAGASPATPVVLRARYRVGGTAAGNLVADTQFRPELTTIREATNPQPAAGGGPGESLERARALAPRLFRAQERAVTIADIRELALHFPGVGKARVVPLSWNEILVFVAPAGLVSAPSETLVSDLRAFFEPLRMASAQILVEGGDAVELHLTAQVEAQPYFLERDVRVAVEQAVRDLLAFEAVDFGQRLFISRVYDAIQELPQVLGLTITRFSRSAAGAIDADGVIALAPRELPFLPDPPIVTTITGAVPG